MNIILIAACGSDDRAIGVRGKLPWHLPEDLRRFKARTYGKPVLMGRKTYESIGRPLPGRRNIVISRQQRHWEGCESATSLQAALRMAEEGGAGEVFVIGGGEIYAAALPLAHSIYLTEVDQRTPQGDAFFPVFNPSDWQVASEEHPEVQEPTPSYAFKEYTRR